MLKHCELCGKQSNDCKQSYLTVVKHVIYVPSKQVLFHDPVTQNITLQNGSKFSYTMIDSDFAFVCTQELTNHFFCSDTCATEMTRTPISFEITRQLGEVRFGDTLPYWNLAFRKELILEHKKYCDWCGSSYYSTGFNHASQITQRTVKESFYKNKANFPKHEISWIILSDTSNEKYYGYDYIYINEQVFTQKDFCSNECRYKYSRKNNSLIMFLNNLMNTLVGVISPDILELNKALSNPYLYKPRSIKF